MHLTINNRKNKQIIREIIITITKSNDRENENMRERERDVLKESWRWNTNAEEDEEETLKNDLKAASHWETHSTLRVLFFEAH
jgi:hypothetical protein